MVEKLKFTITFTMVHMEKKNYKEIKKSTLGKNYNLLISNMALIYKG